VAGGERILGWAAVVMLSAVMAAPSARAQDACQVYSEGFEIFAGPQDFDDGTFRVQWCPDGATVVAGSFCPTDGAWRLSSGSVDPVVRV